MVKTGSVCLPGLTARGTVLQFLITLGVATFFLPSFIEALVWVIYGQAMLVAGWHVGVMNVIVVSRLVGYPDPRPGNCGLGVLMQDGLAWKAGVVESFLWLLFAVLTDYVIVSIFSRVFWFFKACFSQPARRIT